MQLKRWILYVFCIMFPCMVWGQSRDSARSKLTDTTMLGEIIISAKTAVKIHGDTVSYTVDSFYKNSMATAEDVLKRLPGVDVSREGKITIQGKEVTKIFINGKEYQAEDLRTITQNLPAEVLQKIQVADWYDEQTQHSGIKKNSDEKSINLQFKKEYEHGVYGRLAAGYGSKDRYQAGAFGNYMGSNLRITTIINANNTGIADATNDASSDNSKTSNTPGIITKKHGNLNFSYDGIKKLKLNGLYEVGTNNTDMVQAFFRTTYLPGDSQLLRRQATTQFSGNTQHRFNLRSEYKINDLLNMTTQVNASYKLGDVKRDATDITYYNTTAQPDFQRESKVNNNTLSPALRFSNMLQKRFRKKGRTLSFNANINYSADDREGVNENLNQYFLPPSANTNIFESLEAKNNWDTKLNLQYTEPLSERSSLSANYTNLYTYNRSDRKVYLRNNGDKTEDTTQTRYYENTNIENPFGLVYQYSTEKITAGAGLDVQPYNRESRTVMRRNTTVSQVGTNYFPNLFSRFQFSKAASLSINYSGSITSPGISQLQPIPDYTDSLNIFIGNPLLRPEVSNNMTLSYNLFDSKTQRVLWANIRGNWVNRKIINKVDINASRRVTTPVNIDGAYNLSGALNYTQPAINKKLKVSVGINTGITRNITITNGQLVPVENYNLQPNTRVVINAVEWYEGEIGYSYKYNTVNSATAITSNVLQAHNLSSDGTFFLPLGIKLGYYVNYVSNIGLSNSFDNDFVLVNLRLDKTFTKPKGLTLRIQAFDMFNNYPNVQRVVSDNYFEDKSFNRIGSYLMFSVIYRFSYFPSSGSSVEEEQ